MANGKDGVDILFPVGRMVQGSLYTPNTTDAENRPLVYKTGPQAGSPRVDYFFAVAIPKTPGVSHFANEPGWGATIWEFAHRAWPAGQAQRPDFAWKIVDGDSTVPDKKGVKPCDREGYRGHWIVKFGGGYQPKIVNRDGSAAITEEGVVKPGHFVQVFGNVTSNNSTQTAGLHMNHRIVAHSGYGPEITYGPDAASVGFGAAPLPAGASAVPLGGMTTANAAGQAATPPPPVPGANSHGAATASPPPPPAVATASTPTPPANTQFVAGAAGATPPPPPPPPAAAAGPVRTMTPKAGGASYESMIAAGWTDDTLVQHGMMVVA